jgi:AraC-like DNA-binding protein
MYRVNTSIAPLNKAYGATPRHGYARRRAIDADDDRLWRKQRQQVISPSLQDSYRDESIAVSETDEIAQGSLAAYRSWRSVAAAAHEVGYESPTHFSREYARLFSRPLQKIQRKSYRQ